MFPQITHFNRVLAPAVRNADIGLFFPANVFLAGARAVAVNSPGRSLAGINSLRLDMIGEVDKL